MRISAISLVLLWAACSFNLLADDTYHRGDVNRDGSVDINDVSSLIDLILNPNQDDQDDQEQEQVLRDSTYTVNGVSFKMIKVDHAKTELGATSEQDVAMDDEYPVHQVALSDYCIGETEVTQGLWTAVMGSNPASGSGYGVGDDYPVYNVSWDDCQQFIAN